MIKDGRLIFNLIFRSSQFRQTSKPSRLWGRSRLVSRRDKGPFRRGSPLGCSLIKFIPLWLWSHSSAGSSSGASLKFSPTGGGIFHFLSLSLATRFAFISSRASYSLSHSARLIDLTLYIYGNKNRRGRDDINCCFCFFFSSLQVGRVLVFRNHFHITSPVAPFILLFGLLFGAGALAASRSFSVSGRSHRWTHSFRPPSFLSCSPCAARAYSSSSQRLLNELFYVRSAVFDIPVRLCTTLRLKLE